MQAEKSDVFRLRLLPASDGDCLLLSWGAGGPLNHMVIDGGRKAAYRHLHKELAAIAAAGEKVAVYVLTHVDADHIEGPLAYLEDAKRAILPEQIWFNGFEELHPVDSSGMRSMRQGDAWSKAIAGLGLPLNQPFAERVVSIETALSSLDVESLKVTILSPDAAHLAAMRKEWEKYRRSLRRDQDGMRGGNKTRPPVAVPIVVEVLAADGETDKEIPNGSSIAFVAEWKGRRVLLGGDAHPDVLSSSLKRLAESHANGRYRIDLLKASHHGSGKNTSRQLIEAIECRQMAISTNGTLHGHPDPESIARFLRFGPPGRKDIWFNYKNERTQPWSDSETMARNGYFAHYPDDTPGFIEIDLMRDLGA